MQILNDPFFAPDVFAFMWFTLEKDYAHGWQSGPTDKLLCGPEITECKVFIRGTALCQIDRASVGLSRRLGRMETKVQPRMKHG